MPQTKVPPKLYDLAVTKIRQWFVSTAKNIYKEFGDFENVQCQQIVLQINKFLVSSVPAHIIDELYNSSDIFIDITVSRDNVPEPCRVLLPPISCITFDSRIVILMYIHANMKYLTAHKIANDNLWKTTLRSMKKLSTLDLSKVCTDEILEVVGKNCVNLEFVNIASKSCHSRKKDRHNALKLNLCVSDVGLHFLTNCKRLKEIQMTSIIRKGVGGRQVTNEGIKKLLLSLPKLRHINYTDTGLLLDSITLNSGKLSLVSLIDHHPHASRISKMELLCPYLNELHLTYAFSSEECHIGVISALTSSGLKISTLGLTHFPFDDFLKTYLETKGNYLRVFNFVSSCIMSVNDFFILLGRKCPNLEEISVHFPTSGRGNMDNDYPNNLTFGNNELLFSSLKSIFLQGVRWDSNLVLPLLLKNAVSIKKLAMRNSMNEGSLDDVLQQIQKTNLFINLDTVHFFTGANVSVQFLRSFILSCPVLKDIIVESNSQDYVEMVVQLRDELVLKNMNVSIGVFKII